MANERNPDIARGMKAATKGHRQADIADALGTSQGNVSRYVTDEVRASIETIAAIEDACDQPRGFVLRAAGYVADPTSTRDAIAADPLLDADARALVLGAYDAAVDHVRNRRTHQRESEPET